MTPLIRAERPEDFPAIRAVVTAAFGKASEADLVEAIRASAGYLSDYSLVAEEDGEVVGHVMLSHSSLVDGDDVRTVLSLAPLAVAPALHGQGVGGSLVREATRLADAAREPLVILEGSPLYYPRFGFVDSRTIGITFPSLPEWAPPEAGQALPLAAYSPAYRGEVRYPPAFDAAIET
ncbi:MAG TPA: N-acetyltransferase [Acidimicrobiales bacterium]|nr:N-acetyltransferase [Acidimicrobiales bacterium]